MVDARLPPYPLADKSRLETSFNNPSPLPSPTDWDDSHSTHIKKEARAFSTKDSPSGADYEYLERRLREFGTLKAPPASLNPPTPPTTPTNVNNNNANRGENDLIALARAVETNSGCKLAKCVVCERGLPESFHMQKPVSWLSVCKLAMWALTQDGAAYGRKWFSLGRDICPFVEVHKYVCGREFTPNWKTTIGITMSTYAKRANMFIAGNPNELGLGYYMLPEDATDPYLESTPLIIGRHYRTPNPHSQPTNGARSTTPPNSHSRPSSPVHSTAGTLSAPSTPPYSSPVPRPSTPPRRPPSPHQQPTTPSRHRPVTPPPPIITTGLTQRASTPPPTMHLLPSPSASHSPREHFPLTPRSQSPRSQSPHSMSGPHLSGVGSASTTPVHSPNSEMSSEVSQYMNDPACLMGVIRMRRKRFNGDMQRRAIGERKHTTDTERQALLDYYDKFGTCTTVPEFVELQQRLGWDAHRTKIWLYNRKTYHHHRPGDKRKKPRTSSPTPGEGASNYDGESDEELFYAEENDMNSNHSEDNEREKNDMMDEEHQNEYIMELEQHVTSLKQQLESEIAHRKAETKKSQASSARITELEQALEKSESRQEPTEANSEIALLRTQVELYFNDLREEKKKRAQEEIKALDYLAQINALNIRISTLEKALQPGAAQKMEGADPSTQSADSTAAQSTQAPQSTEAQKSDAQSTDVQMTDAQVDDAQRAAPQFDAQGRKVFPSAASPQRMVPPPPAQSTARA